MLDAFIVCLLLFVLFMFFVLHNKFPSGIIKIPSSISLSLVQLLCIFIICESVDHQLKKCKFKAGLCTVVRRSHFVLTLVIFLQTV